MNRRQLGHSGVDIPPVCMGTYTLAGAWAGDLDAAKTALRTGVERGLGFLDTAHAYGRAEAAIGAEFAAEMRADRDLLVLCSKGGLDLRARDGAQTPFAPNSSPEFLRSCLEKSLERLGTDHLDLYLVHWYDPEVPVAEVADAMGRFLAEGLVRAIGVSNYTVAQMEQFQAITPIGAIQVPYSLFSRGVEAEVLPFAVEHGIGVMGYAALAQGYLSGTFGGTPSFAAHDFRNGAPDFSGDRYAARVRAAAGMTEIAIAKGCTLPDLAVAWVTASSVPVVPLVGVQAPAHVDALEKALEIELTDAELTQLRELSASAPEMDFLGLVS
jgi:aryl-alcohol dehydrogenase-like predicted oxidoreductase